DAQGRLGRPASDRCHRAQEQQQEQWRQLGLAGLAVEKGKELRIGAATRRHPVARPDGEPDFPGQRRERAASVDHALHPPRAVDPGLAGGPGRLVLAPPLRPAAQNRPGAGDLEPCSAQASWTAKEQVVPKLWARTVTVARVAAALALASLGVVVAQAPAYAHDYQAAINYDAVSGSGSS